MILKYLMNPVLFWSGKVTSLTVRTRPEIYSTNNNKKRKNTQCHDLFLFKTLQCTFKEENNLIQNSTTNKPPLCRDHNQSYLKPKYLKISQYPISTNQNTGNFQILSDVRHVINFFHLKSSCLLRKQSELGE